MPDYINNTDSNSKEDKMKEIFRITFYIMLFTAFVSIIVLSIFYL